MNFFALFIGLTPVSGAAPLEIIPVEPSLPSPSIATALDQTEAPPLEKYRPFGWFRRRIFAPNQNLPSLPTLREALRHTYLEADERKRNRIADEMTMQFLQTLLQVETVFFLGIGNALEPLSPEVESEVQAYLALLQKSPMDSLLFVYDGDSLAAPLLEKGLPPGRGLALKSNPDMYGEEGSVLVNPWLRLFFAKHTRHQIYTPDSPYLLAAQFEPTRHYPLILDPQKTFPRGYKHWIRFAEEALTVWNEPKRRTWWEWLQGLDQEERMIQTKVRLTHSAISEPPTFEYAEALVQAMGSWLIRTDSTLKQPFSLERLLTDLSETALFEILYRISFHTTAAGPKGIPIWMTESPFQRLEPSLKELGKRLKERGLMPLLLDNARVQKQVTPAQVYSIETPQGCFDEDDRFLAITEDAPLVLIGPPDAGVLRHLGALWLKMSEADSLTKILFFDCDFYEPLMAWIARTNQPKSLKTRIQCTRDLNQWIVKHL
jgi:hypothetical protein